jgi:peptide/nickel transport system ATP-binding protein
MLLEAAPQMDGFGREVQPPEGEIPDPINPPPGCAFHPRCPISQDVCKRQRPEMRVLNGSRVACHLAE